MSLGRAKGAAPGAAHALVAEAALDAFLALAASERPCDVPQPWGEKVGHSVFDEEEILGALEPKTFSDLDLEGWGWEALGGAGLERIDRAAADAGPCCPICLEELSQGQVAWRLPCLHVFHRRCIVRLLRSRRAHGACPVCRCDIKRFATASPDEIASGACAA